MDLERGRPRSVYNFSKVLCVLLNLSYPLWSIVVGLPGLVVHSRGSIIHKAFSTRSTRQWSCCRRYYKTGGMRHTTLPNHSFPREKGIACNNIPSSSKPIITEVLDFCKIPFSTRMGSRCLTQDRS